MAKPAILQKLRHGKLLCGKVFNTFVETWNWLVGAFDHLKGDYDVNRQTGHIKVDRTDPDNPVIRLVGMPNGGGCIVEGSAERITDNDSDEKTLVDIYADPYGDIQKLKVNKSRLVTIDDKQTISGRKTFSSLVDIKYDPNDDNKKRVLVIRSDSIEYWAYNSQYAYLKNSVVDSSNGYFDFSSAYPIRVSTTNLTIPTPNTQLVKPSSESASVKATDAVNVQYLRDNLKSLMVNGTEVSKVVSSDNINITTSGSGTISTTDIDVVVDVVYDTSVTPPKLVKKTRKVRAIVGASTDITISDVFVAVPHQSHD